MKSSANPWALAIGGALVSDFEPPQPAAADEASIASAIADEPNGQAAAVCSCCR
jgi:hypothetical protein